MPGLRAGPSWRVVSPSGGSILITSAPRSPSCWAAHGPSTTVVQSRILTPSNGPAIDVTSQCFLPDYHKLVTRVRETCPANHSRRHAEAISADLAMADVGTRRGAPAAKCAPLGSMLRRPSGLACARHDPR